MVFKIKNVIPPQGKSKMEEPVGRCAHCWEEVVWHPLRRNKNIDKIIF